MEYSILGSVPLEKLTVFVESLTKGKVEVPASTETVGDYPIAYENIEIIFNNGIDAIAEIKDEKSVAKYVYLKRLVRPDDTGIWTVIGYDPAQE